MTWISNMYLPDTGLHFCSLQCSSCLGWIGTMRNSDGLCPPVACSHLFITELYSAAWACWSRLILIINLPTRYEFVSTLTFPLHWTSDLLWNFLNGDSSCFSTQYLLLLVVPFELMASFANIKIHPWIVSSLRFIEFFYIQNNNLDKCKLSGWIKY